MKILAILYGFCLHNSGGFWLIFVLGSLKSETKRTRVEIHANGGRSHLLTWLTIPIIITYALLPGRATEN